VRTAGDVLAELQGLCEVEYVPMVRCKTLMGELHRRGLKASMHYDDRDAPPGLIRLGYVRCVFPDNFNPLQATAPVRLAGFFQPN
jgi:hypothetical protein